MGGRLAFRHYPLNRSNFKDTPLASGSIPLVMSGVQAIDGADPGVYRDGGMIDYHLDLPYRLDAKALVVMPHFSGKIIPGWLDKQLTWRRPARANMGRVVIIAPSPEFVRQLPGAKIPDRTDFKTFFQQDKERFKAWDRTVEMCRAPSEAFMEWVASGRIRSHPGCGSADGFYLNYFTTKRLSTDDTIRLEDAACGYKGLMVIERCFRSSKRTHIKMMPMYHWSSRSTEVHVKICVLALLIERASVSWCVASRGIKSGELWVSFRPQNFLI